MNIYTKKGKLFVCIVITCIIYFSVNYIYTLITNKVIQQNEQNKTRSLHFLVDR